MSNISLSTTTIDNTGEVVIAELPGNFDKLSLRKQKEVVVKVFQENLIMLNSFIQQKEDAAKQAKHLASKIKMSKEAKELARLRKDIKQLEGNLMGIKAESAGAMRVCKELGFDVSAEMRKMKLVE